MCYRCLREPHHLNIEVVTRREDMLRSVQSLNIGCLQVLHDMIMPHTDSGAAVGDAIASFGAVAVLAPRGRFEIELYGSFMKLLGQVRSLFCFDNPVLS